MRKLQHTAPPIDSWWNSVRFVDVDFSHRLEVTLQGLIELKRPAEAAPFQPRVESTRGPR